MSEKNWTPEPWGNGITEVFDADGFRVATLTRRQSRPHETITNAARIVSCVNACAGIANPAAIPALVEAAKAMRDFAGLVADGCYYGDEDGCKRTGHPCPSCLAVMQGASFDAALAALQEKPNE